MKRFSLNPERDFRTLAKKAAIEDQELFGFGYTMDDAIKAKADRIASQGPLTRDEIAEAKKDPFRPIGTTKKVWALRRRLGVSFGPGSPENG